ncbi:MAG TPA: DUF2167 domain-containing protein [Hyalangium sp.]|nr:DUF2167 domain-containing protein [Hyalangium sp.]
MAVGLLLTPIVALADVAPLEEAEEPIQQQEDTPQETPEGVKPGPAQIELGHDLALDVPEDFQEGTDKVAEYGLAGIVLGGAGLGAAKLAKVGPLAKAGKFLIALLVGGKKFIAIAAIGLIVLLKKLFGGKGSSSDSNNP